MGTCTEIQTPPPPPPSPPTGLVAQCSANGTSFSFSWNASSGATFYQPRVYPTAQGECTGYGWQLWAGDGQTCLAPNDQYYGTSVPNFPAVPGKAYSVWVHASNSAGASAPTSIAVTCPAPTPQNPDLVGYVGGAVTTTVNQAASLYGSVANTGAGAAGYFPNIFQVCDGNCATYNVAVPATAVGSMGSGASQQISGSHTPTVATQLYYRTCANMNTNWQHVVAEDTYANNCSGWQLLTVNNQPNQAPVGYLDGASCEAVGGWAYDPDVASQAINVHIYMNGSFAATVPANQYRGDLCGYGSCNHAFSWTVPQQYFTGQTFSVAVYGIDAQGGTNPQLYGSPKTIQCSAPVQQPDLVGYVGGAVTATVNQAVTLYGAVGNTGGPAGAFANIFEVCTSGCITFNQTVAATSIGSLGTGEMAQVSGSFTPPTTEQLYYRTCGGYNTARQISLAEPNYLNNCSGWQLLTATEPPQAPDLTAGSVSPTSATAGTPVTLYAAATNVGGGTSGSFPILFQVSETGELFNSGYLGGLAAGASGTGSASHTFSAAGTYQVRACANYNTAWTAITTESNYGNNCGPWTSITVAPLEVPALSCSVSPTTIAPGQSVTYAANPSGGAAGPYTWTASDGASVGSGASVTRTLTTPGTYAMHVRASGTSVSYCPNVAVEASWCSTESTVLTITATPSRVRSGESVALSWNATGVNGQNATCTVSGPGVSWSAAVSANPSCSAASSANPTITTQSTYTLTCGGQSESVTVNVIPSFREF